MYEEMGDITRQQVSGYKYWSEREAVWDRVKKGPRMIVFGSLCATKWASASFGSTWKSTHVTGSVFKPFQKRQLILFYIYMHHVQVNGMGQEHSKQIAAHRWGDVSCQWWRVNIVNIIWGTENTNIIYKLER